jgi:hypothetical protein
MTNDIVTRTVTVDIHTENGRWYAGSDYRDILGLILSHEDREQLLSVVPEAIAALYKHKEPAPEIWTGR